MCIPKRDAEWRINTEKTLLGTMMIEPAALETVACLIDAGHFISPAHRIIFRAIMALRACGRDVDSLTVREHIRKSGKLRLVGGPNGIDGLVQYSYGPSTPIAYLARRLTGVE